MGSVFTKWCRRSVSASAELSVDGHEIKYDTESGLTIDGNSDAIIESALELGEEILEELLTE